MFRVSPIRICRPPKKAQILGEARFLRAYHYSHLVRNYGPVVLQLHTIVVDPNTMKSRSPVDSVYAQIIRDLKDAEAALPVSYADQASSHSRATQGAAEAVLAKVYAQMGDYQDCLTYCNKVLPPAIWGYGYGRLCPNSPIMTGSSIASTKTAQSPFSSFSTPKAPSHTDTQWA